MTRKLLLLVALFAVMLAGAVLAQDDTPQPVVVGGAEVTVLPLSVVTDAAPVAQDITDTSARVNFVGTEPLACYLIYGTDLTYGDVTNDPDMAQAAIVEHNPVLTNLEPDTEYFYRMQGVGEDGTLYVSAVYSFRTLPAQGPDTANLLSAASGARIVDVSSNFGNGPDDGRWGIRNAFDGNDATEWSSNGDGDDAYFVVELAARSRITEVVYRTRAMSDGTAITESFTLTNEAGEVFGPFAVPTAEDVVRYEVDIVAGTLRYDVATSTGGNTGIVDIAAYGEQLAAR